MAILRKMLLSVTQEIVFSLGTKYINDYGWNPPRLFWRRTTSAAMRIEQKQPFWSGWYSHKFNGPGVRYEVAVCIRTGAIVWIHGPFPCGAWPDIKIFRHALVNMLEAGERVESDAGYIGEHPAKTCIPDPLDTPAKADMRSRVRARHETVNKRFKNFGCMKQVFRQEDLVWHSACFRAVAVITQLSFDAGEPVFDVDYDDSVV